MQVIAYFRGRYGEKILSAPITQGFNLLAWVVPFVAIVAGGALIAFTAGRWRASSETSTPSETTSTRDPSSDRFDAALRRNLERELRDRI